MSEGRLEGSVALVTGAASGIGLAIANRFAKEGAAVCIADRDEEGARAACENLKRDGFRAMPFRVDVVDETLVRDMVAATVKELGGLDILVTSAGVGGSAKLAEFPLELWNEVIGINLTGTFLCTREAAAHMIEQRRGRIIHIASIFGQRGVTYRAAYSASKGGVISLMQTAAVELAPYGITVNAISPGPIKTPLADRLHTEATREGFFRTTPMRRYGLPEEIADAAAFLASSEANYITGHDLNVDGGYGAAGIIFREVMA